MILETSGKELSEALIFALLSFRFVNHIIIVIIFIYCYHLPEAGIQVQFTITNICTIKCGQRLLLLQVNPVLQCVFGQISAVQSSRWSLAGV